MNRSNKSGLCNKLARDGQKKQITGAIFVSIMSNSIAINKFVPLQHL